MASLFAVFGVQLAIIYTVFLGGRSKAIASCSKCPLWDPSQKGLFFDWPQRQIEMIVLPASPYRFPSLSAISKSPSIFTEPLLLIVSCVVAMLFIFLFKVNEIIIVFPFFSFNFCSMITLSVKLCKCKHLIT